MSAPEFPPNPYLDETLQALAQKHQVAEAVIGRLSNFMDAEALRAIADGVSLNLDTLEQAAECAPALQAKLRELNTTGIPAEVAAEFDVRTDKPLLRISRRHHGNIKSSVLTQDFVHGADYAALAEADIVVLLQAHAAYDLADIQAKSKLIFDTRGKLTGANVVRL